MAKKEWIRLEEGDDWGTKYVAIKALSGSFQTANAKRGLNIKAKEKCSIRWPDGTIEEVVLLLRCEVNEVSDMGYDYKVECFVPGFKYSVNGLQVWVELTKVEVRREWAEAHSPQLVD